MVPSWLASLSILRHFSFRSILCQLSFQLVDCRLLLALGLCWCHWTLLLQRRASPSFCRRLCFPWHWSCSNKWLGRILAGHGTNWCCVDGWDVEWSSMARWTPLYKWSKKRWMGQLLKWYVYDYSLMTSLFQRTGTSSADDAQCTLLCLWRQFDKIHKWCCLDVLNIDFKLIERLIPWSWNLMSFNAPDASWANVRLRMFVVSTRIRWPPNKKSCFGRRTGLKDARLVVEFGQLILGHILAGFFEFFAFN